MKYGHWTHFWIFELGINNWQMDLLVFHTKTPNLKILRWWINYLTEKWWKAKETQKMLWIYMNKIICQKKFRKFCISFRNIFIFVIIFPAVIHNSKYKKSRKISKDFLIKVKKNEMVWQLDKIWQTCQNHPSRDNAEEKAERKRSKQIGILPELGLCPTAARNGDSWWFVQQCSDLMIMLVHRISDSHPYKSCLPLFCTLYILLFISYQLISKYFFSLDTPYFSLLILHTFLSFHVPAYQIEQTFCQQRILQ